jgi:hypothetical protein
MRKFSATMMVFAGLLIFAASAYSTQYIYGIHWWESGADQIMNAKKGWDVEIINADGIHNPGNLEGDKVKLRNIIQEGFTPVIRINWGWFETIPRPDTVSYAEYANRCAMIIDELYNHLGDGLRVKWFQIGNEYNLDYEYQPVGDGYGAPASVYNQYFNTVYNKVKSTVPGAGNIKVLVGPVANWAPNRPSDGYAGNPPVPAQGFYYDRYYKAVVQGIPQCDGYAIHTYGGHRNITLPHGLGGIYFGVDNNLAYYPGLDTSNTSGFNSFKVLMRIIDDQGISNVPVLITETNTSAHKTIRRSSSCYSPQPCNPGDDCRLIPPALTYTRGWFQEAYRKINDWNNSKSQKILALCWFVYKAEGEWTEFAIDNSAPCNMVQARADFNTTTATTNYVSPGIDRGQPREQYARVYWVVDNRVTFSQLQQIVAMAYPNRRTVGFSYDDAGIGDLDGRHVAVWGDQIDRNLLLNWYRENYGGVTVEFQALPGQGTWHYGPYATSEPSADRGQPREQYAREYWVVDSRASLQQVQAIVGQAYARRNTVGFSHDDAGIGDLDQRHVVVWGNEYPQSVLRTWYNQNYPGVTVEFRSMP